MSGNWQTILRAVGRFTPWNNMAISFAAMNVVLVLCGVLLPSGLAFAHPRHASIAEAEWNPRTGRLEVALQVNPVDLELALRRMAARPLDLDRSTDIERYVQDYLVRSFVVRHADGTRAKLIWVGFEADVRDAWLYFEVPLTGGLDNVTFAAGLFFELIPDQANTINFRVGKRRTSLTMTAEQLEAVFHATDAGAIERSRVGQSGVSR